MLDFFNFKKMLKLLLPSALLVSQISSSDAPHKRFEYKYSFKGPQLTQTNGAVPFWTHHGHAIASEEQIRLTPSLRSRAGTVWAKNPTSFDSWEIEVWIRVSGKSRIGADGMAIWYTQDKGTQGRVFGASDGWNGLMIMLDSFDNNSKQDNPLVAVIKNDGTQSFDHQNDGEHQILGSCRRDYRNKVYPVKLKIIYRNRNLVLLYDQGLTDFEDYEVCAKISDIDLPSNGYFGVSAATGGLADDHDVLKFLTYSLSEKTAQNSETVQVDKKQEEAYKQNKEQFEKVKKEQAEKDGTFASDDGSNMDVSDFEIKRIYEVTSAIHRHVQDSHSLLAEVRKYMVTAANKVGGSNGPSDITKFDINNLKTQAAESIKLLHELKQSVRNMDFKAPSGNAVANNNNGVALTPNHLNMLSSTKINTDNLARQVSDVKQMVQDTQETCKMLDRKSESVVSGGDSDCATTGTLFLFTIVQVVLIVATMTWLQKSGMFVNKQKFF